MKKIIFFFLICISIHGTSQPYQWTQMAYLSHPLYAPASFSLGNNVYMVSGLINPTPKITTSDVWAYNTLTNTWTQMGNFPGPSRYGTRGFTIGNYGYVTCGWTTTGSLIDTWQYDAVTDTWLQKADFIGTNRYTMANFEINGIGYVACGFTPYTNTMYAYDPVNDVWTQMASLPGIDRQAPVYFAHGGFGYCGMGASASGYLKDFYKYDPFNNTWTALNNFPDNPIEAAYQFEVNNIPFIAMGITWDTIQNIEVVSNKVWEYDITNDQWNLSIPFPDTAIFEGGFASCNGCGYLGFGSRDRLYNSNSYTAQFWRFCSTSGVNEYETTNNIKVLSLGNNHFKINAFAFSQQKIILKLYDEKGKIVQTIHNNMQGVFDLKLSDLKSAVYIYKVSDTKGNSSTGKIIVS